MTTTAKAKLCIECKHFEGDLQYPRCNALYTLNLVNGKLKKADCYPERASGERCGPEGKQFERGQA